MVVAQLLRYIVTGVTSTAIDIACLHFLLQGGVAQALAVAIAFFTGMVVNLLMHKWFTFRDPGQLHGAQVARYLTVVAINLGVTEAVVWASTAWLGLPPLAGKLLSLPPVLLLGFTLSRAWVFAGRRAG